MNISKCKHKNKPKNTNLQQKKKHKRHRSAGKNNRIKAIDDRVNKFFDSINLTQIAKDTGYLIRNSPITPFIFIYALSLAMCGSTQSLDLLALNINDIFSISITGSAFCDRMNQKKSILFLKTCFEFILDIQVKLAFKNNFGASITSLFKEIIIEDSTIVELNESVKKSLKGSGGAASKSSIKFNFVFNLCLYAVIAVSIFSGSTPDRKNHKKSLKHIKKGMLLIRDLGYLAVESLKTLQANGAFYLSRLYKGTFLYLNKDDAEPLDIEKFFKKVTANGFKSASITIFMGKKDRFQTTLVIEKVPKSILKKRIKKYKEKNSGKLPSHEYVTWAGYSVFITNIPQELLKMADESYSRLIIKIYKIRWQIELLFKKFKTTIKLGDINAKNKNRVMCLVYGKLIAIMLSIMVLSYAASQNYKGREISLSKVIAWLMSEKRLARAILNGALLELYSKLRREFKLLCKDKRNRQTAQAEFVEMFPRDKLAA